MYLVGFIIRIYHDARSPERQTQLHSYEISTANIFRADNIPNSKEQRTSAITLQSRGIHTRNILTARHYYSCREMMSTQLICGNFVLFRLSTEHFLLQTFPS